MSLESAGKMAELDRYIGYWKPYAISHEELDADLALQQEVEIAARILLPAVQAKRSGKFGAVAADMRPPRQK